MPSKISLRVNPPNYSPAYHTSHGTGFGCFDAPLPYALGNTFLANQEPQQFEKEANISK
jgi:hypothetical protein